MAGTSNEPIRIVHVMNALAVAGMEVGVIKLVNRQDPARFRSVLCCLMLATEDSIPLVNPRTKVRVLGKKPGIDLSLVPKLVRIFREERAQIVHSHNWATTLYTVLAAKIARVPVLIHGEHGYDSQAAIERRLGFKRLLAGQATRLTTVSSDIERLLVERWGVAPEDVTTIPNGIELDRFPERPDPGPLRRELGLTPEHRVLMSVGRFVPVKNLPFLIRSFARVHERHPEARLVLVGAGDPAELARLAESRGVRDAVLFPGPRGDVPALLALCDVYVNSSSFEGMSNTILEAMAASRPVVATAVGGNPELVREGETGFLVPSGDEEALAGRLATLLERSDLRAAMGAEGRRVVERDHPIGRTVERYNAMYEETWLRHRLRASEPPPEAARRAVARALRYSGLTWLRGVTERRSLTILGYHRVLPLPESLRYPFPSMAMPRDLFERQIAHLRRHYTLLPLGEGAERLRSGDLPPRAVCVTFDDGYRDNFDHALPVLRKYGVPATFFLVTGALEGTYRFLWDEVVSRVRQIRDQRAAPRLLGEQIPGWLAEKMRRLEAGAPADQVGEGIVRDMNRVSLPEREAGMEALRRATPDGAACADPPVLTWDEVREMRRAGMLVGAHTVTHPFLDELEPADARREIGESIHTVMARLGEPVSLFSYPRGRFNEVMKEYLEDFGIQAAVTTRPGRNPAGTDPFALRRLDAGYCRIHAGGDPVLLDVELQGWFEPLRAGKAR